MEDMSSVTAILLQKIERKVLAHLQSEHWKALKKGNAEV